MTHRRPDLGTNAFDCAASRVHANLRSLRKYQIHGSSAAHLRIYHLVKR